MSAALSASALGAASLFALASYGTPGPNNTMILSSAVHFGLRRSLPHLLGIILGFAFMQLAVGLGLYTLLAQHPALLQGLRWVGSAWLLWMAWQLASAPVGEGHALVAPRRPMGFWQACAFQWVNPKAWVMAVTALSTYLSPQASGADIATLVLLLTLVGAPCVLAWAWAGQGLRQWLRDPVRLRRFNITMALALVASLLTVLE